MIDRSFIEENIKSSALAKNKITKSTENTKLFTGDLKLYLQKSCQDN